MKAVFGLLLLGGCTLAAELPREIAYAAAAQAGSVVPLFANGYLVYLDHPDRLQVFGPDTQLVYGYRVPCPGQASSCSVSAVAIGRGGAAALAFGFKGANGYAAGIRLLDKAGTETKFIPTARYVPRQLAFDRSGDLWALGWERDRDLSEQPSREHYHVLRKYSSDGVLKGEFLPRSLWDSKYGPSLGGGGYWTMYASEERVGAIFNEDFSGRTPEWVEWDLTGAMLSRTSLAGGRFLRARAFSGAGRLYAQFRDDASAVLELKVLDTASGQWKPVRSNLPDGTNAYLLGADAEALVYRVHRNGQLHLVWAKPD